MKCWYYTESGVGNLKEVHLVTSTKEYVDDLWWLFILQGIATLLFGVVALFIPGLTLAVLVIVFAVYAVVAGVIEIVHGFTSMGKDNSWWFALLIGLILTGIGVYLIRNPLIALGSFIILVGMLLLVRGIFDLVVAVFYSDKHEHRWLWGISGILGIVAGIIIWSNPAGGGLAFVWALGLYALIAGSISLAYAFQIRSSRSAIDDAAGAINKKPAGSAPRSRR